MLSATASKPWTAAAQPEVVAEIEVEKCFNTFFDDPLSTSQWVGCSCSVQLQELP